MFGTRPIKATMGVSFPLTHPRNPMTAVDVPGKGTHLVEIHCGVCAYSTTVDAGFFAHGVYFCYGRGLPLYVSTDPQHGPPGDAAA